MKIRQLANRMAKEGIPEHYAKQLIQQSASWEELRLRIKNYLSSIDADNVNQKIIRICCKSTK